MKQVIGSVQYLLIDPLPFKVTIGLPKGNEMSFRCTSQQVSRICKKETGTYSTKDGGVSLDFEKNEISILDYDISYSLDCNPKFLGFLVAEAMLYSMEYKCLDS